MRQWRRGLIGAVLAVLIAVCSWAASVTTVSVDSATAGVQVVTAVGGGVTVTIPSTAAVPIWVARLDSTCSTSLTAPRGVRIAPGNGFDFLASEGWSGGLCAILESGVVAVTASINKW